MSLLLITASLNASSGVTTKTEAVATVPFLKGVIDLTEHGTSKTALETVQLLQELESKGRVLKTGTDADLRAAFVGAQLDVERYLTLLMRSKKAHNVMGIIHTPAPATPLCKEATQEISRGLVAREIFEDEKRAYTVKERAVYIREFLDSSGVLIVAYPEDGRNIRSKDELAVFHSLLQKYPNLTDKPLPITTLPEHAQGATYLFETQKGEKLCFSIRSFQANDPKDGREWGVWFGSVTDPQIAERLSAVLGFINNEVAYE